MNFTSAIARPNTTVRMKMISLVIFMVQCVIVYALIIEHLFCLVLSRILSSSTGCCLIYNILLLIKHLQSGIKNLMYLSSIVLICCSIVQVLLLINKVCTSNNSGFKRFFIISNRLKFCFILLDKKNAFKLLDDFSVDLKRPKFKRITSNFSIKVPTLSYGQYLIRHLGWALQRNYLGNFNLSISYVPLVNSYNVKPGYYVGVEFEKKLDVSLLSGRFISFPFVSTVRIATTTFKPKL